MTDVFKFYIDTVADFVDMFNSTFVLQVFGISLGLIDVAVGFIALGMIATVFWKGAKG